jgi:hypothetical protein
MSRPRPPLGKLGPRTRGRWARHAVPLPTAVAIHEGIALTVASPTKAAGSPFPPSATGGRGLGG